ncbi:MAG: CbiX/SirB N-terminal domain-containing protein [Rubrivivax sp.]
MTTKPGLILFAHGARDPAWAQPFEAVAAAVRAARPSLPVRLAFLELMTPDLGGAAAALVAEGCDTVTVLPLFLGAGGHVRRDLPALLEQVQAEQPTLRLSVRPAIGELPDVVQAMARAALATIDPP